MKSFPEVKFELAPFALCVQVSKSLKALKSPRINCLLPRNRGYRTHFALKFLPAARACEMICTHD